MTNRNKLLDRTKGWHIEQELGKLCWQIELLVGKEQRKLANRTRLEKNTRPTNSKRGFKID